MLLVCLSFSCGERSKDCNHEPKVNNQESGTPGDLGLHAGSEPGVGESMKTREARSRKEEGPFDSTPPSGQISGEQIITHGVVNLTLGDAGSILTGISGGTPISSKSNRELLPKVMVVIGVEDRSTERRIKCSAGTNGINAKARRDNVSIEDENKAIAGRIKSKYLMREVSRVHHILEEEEMDPAEALEEMKVAEARGRKRGTAEKNEGEEPVPSVASTDHTAVTKDFSDDVATIPQESIKSDREEVVASHVYRAIPGQKNDSTTNEEQVGRKVECLDVSQSMAIQTASNEEDTVEEQNKKIEARLVECTIEEKNKEMAARLVERFQIKEEECIPSITLTDYASGTKSPSNEVTCPLNVAPTTEEQEDNSSFKTASRR